MLDKLKGAASKASAMAGDLQGLAVEKLRATAQELNESLPLLSAVGYAVGRICIEVGISPKIMISLIKMADVADEAFDNLLRAHSGRKMLSVLVGALRQANVLQAKIQFRNHLFREIEIELGIPPAIRMVFLDSTTSVTLITPAAAPQIAVASAPFRTLAPVPVAVSPELLEPAPFSEPAPAESPAVAELPVLEMIVPLPAGSESVDVPAPSLAPDSAVSIPVPSESLVTPPAPTAAEQSPAEPASAADTLIRFRCPQCRVRYRVSAERIGEMFSCQRCQKELTIPAASAMGVT